MSLEIFLLCIATFYLIWWWAFVPYLLRRARADLFDLRDKAFVKLRNKPEHEQLREYINRLIRYAEQASWQRLLLDVCFALSLRSQPNVLPRFKNKELGIYFAQSLVIVGKLFILRSPLLIVLYSATAIAALIYTEFFAKLKKSFKQLIIRDMQLATRRT